jgi:XTP/dITP diphosphohydrolase
MEILFGSNNQHKIREIKDIFNLHFQDNYRMVSLSEVSDTIDDVEETGSSLHENAFIKAKYFSELTGLPCFADDTGLEIDALNGQPGVQSARFSGIHGDDSANRKEVLSLMMDVPDSQRKARFKTVICFVAGNEIHYAEGVCEGKIIEEEKGLNGFGYDSIFVPDGFTTTFAEMSAEEKNRLSHRRKALENLVALLELL